MRDVRNEVGILSESMSGLATIGRSLTLAYSVPMAAIGGFAIQAASDFDAAMRNINSLLFLTEDQLASVSDQVLDFGANIRGGALGAAEAMYIAVSAGIEDSALAMQFMEIASRTAEAGLADLEITTEALTAAFLSYGGITLDAAEQTDLLTHASDVLTMTVGLGVGSMNTFGTALGKIFPTAVAVGATLDSVGATMAFLTQRGLTAARAGTSLESAMTALLKPTEAMKESFAELGVASGDELVAQFGSLEEALIAVIETADGSATRLGQIFNNKEARRAVQLIFDDIEQYRGAVKSFSEGVDGMTMRAHEQQMKSFAAQWDLLTSAVNAASIAVGNELLPYITPLVMGVKDVLIEVTKLNPELLSLAVTVAGFSALIPPLIWLLSSMINPLSAVLVGVGALATAFVADIGGIRNAVRNLAEDIFGNLGGVETYAKTLINSLFPPQTEEEIRSAIPTVSIGAGELVTVTVKEGDTVWGIWFDQFKDQFTFEEFLAAIDLENPHVIQAGQVLTVSGTFKNDVLSQLQRYALTAQEVIGSIFSNIRRGYATSGVWDTRTHIDLGETIDSGNTDGIFEEFLLPSLRQALDNASKWFDDQVGAGLEWVAGLFKTDGTADGDTPVYRAFEELLSGDLFGAIDEIVPGAGTHLATVIGGWGASISSAFPKIQEAVGTLLTNVGNWIVDTGLPTLARGVGRLAAGLASALYDALALAFNFVTGGGLAGTAGSVGGYISGTLFKELQAGWDDGLAGTALKTEGIPAVETAFTSFATSLETAFSGVLSLFDTLEVDKFYEGVVKFGEGLGDMVGSLAEADWSGVEKLIAIGALFAGGITLIINAFTGELIGSAGDMLSTFGLALAALVDTLAAIGRGDAQGALNKLGDGVLYFVGTLLQVPAGIIDSIVATIESLFGIDLNVPDLSQELNTWLSDIQASFEEAAAARDFVTEIEGGVEITGLTMDNQDSIRDLFERNYYPYVTEAFETYLADNPPTAVPTNLRVGWDNGVITFLADGSEPVVINAGDMPVTMHPTTMHVDASTATPTLLGELGVVAVDTAQFDVDNFLIRKSGGNGSAGLWSDIPETVLPVGELATHLTTEMQTAATALATTMAEEIAAGGTADPQKVTDNFLIPIQNAFVTYLGADSTIVQTITDFMTSTTTSISSTLLSFAALGVATGVTMAGMALTIMIAKPTILSDLGSIQGAVDGLAGSFAALAVAAGAALAAMTAAGLVGGFGFAFGGARAEGGDVDRNKAYLVGEQGAEMFVPHSSGTIIPSDVLFGARASSGGEIVYQTVVLNEVSNLDSMLYEARRRGIRL